MTKLILMRNPRTNEVIDPIDLTRELIGWQKSGIITAIETDNMEKLHHHHIELNKLQIRMLELRRSFTTNLN